MTFVLCLAIRRIENSNTAYFILFQQPVLLAPDFSNVETLRICFKLPFCDFLGTTSNR